VDNRGEAERRFGDFLAAFEPTFRHAEMTKNEVWAQLLALAHNTLVDLRVDRKNKGPKRWMARESKGGLQAPGGWVGGLKPGWIGKIAL
jgi:hypothetical protein